MDETQVQSPEGGEAQPNWWEGHSEEELGQFFQADIAKEHFDRRLQGDVDRLIETAKRGGKLDKVHPKLQQAMREVESAVERRHRDALEAQRQQAFEQQWATWTPEQKAHHFDQRMRHEQESAWLNERIGPMARNEAVKLMARTTAQSLQEGFSPDEWQEAVNVLQEAGIDDSTPEGAAELTKRMIEIVRDYQVEKAKSELQQTLEAEIAKKAEGLRAEMFGKNLKGSEGPDLGRSEGSAPGDEAWAQGLIKGGNASSSELKKAFRILNGSDFEPI